MKHYEYEINLFADGELSAQDQKELFSHLADCGECRKTFSDYLLLKEKSRDFCSQNLSQMKNKPSRLNIFYKVGFYSSAVAAAILLFVLFTNKSAPTYITKNEVRVDTVFVQQDVPYTQNQNVKNSSLTPGKKELNQKRKRQPYLEYLLSLRTEKVTQADLVRIN